MRLLELCKHSEAYVKLECSKVNMHANLYRFLLGKSILCEYFIPVFYKIISIKINNFITVEVKLKMTITVLKQTRSNTCGL